MSSVDTRISVVDDACGETLDALCSILSLQSGDFHAKVTELPGGREALAHAFAAVLFTKGAEIGVERGHFSKVLCQSNPSLRLLCVDAWRPYGGYREHVSEEKLQDFYEETRERLKDQRAVLHRSFSVPAAAHVDDGSLDFVYIDAAHDLPSVIADLAAWVPKVRAGGIVSGHDYLRKKGNVQFHVKDAVNAWVSAYDIAPLFVLRGDRSPSWFYVKR